MVMMLKHCYYSETRARGAGPAFRSGEVVPGSSATASAAEAHRVSVSDVSHSHSAFLFWLGAHRYGPLNYMAPAYDPYTL